MNYMKVAISDVFHISLEMDFSYLIFNKTNSLFQIFDLAVFIKKMTKLQFYYVTSIFALVVSSDARCPWWRHS